MKIIVRTVNWFRKVAGLPPSKKGFLPGPGGVGAAGSGAGSGSAVANLDAYESAYEVNVWINRGVSVIADTCADVPLKLYEWKSVDGDWQAVEVTDHLILDLLEHPRARMSGWSMIREMVSHLYLSGESFVFAENGSSGKSLSGVPKQLQLLKPRFVADITTLPSGEIGSYVYRQAGDERKYEPEFITHIKTFSPRDDLRGLSVIEVARSPVLLDWYMSRHNALFFKHGANPGVVFSSDQTIDPDNVKVMTRDWNKTHAGVENSFRTAFLTRGMKPIPIVVSAKDGEFINLAKLSRDQVLALLGIPPVIVGVLQDVNYATSHDQTRIFYEHTIQPVLRLICDALNTQFIRVWFGPEFERRGLYLAPDYSGVQVLQADQKIQADIAAVYASNGIKTPNEIRDELSLPPIDGGDELRQPGSAFSGFGGTLTGQSPRRAKAVIPPTRGDQWKARDRDFLDAERKIGKAMIEFFADQGKRVASALETQGVLAGPGASVRNIRAVELLTIFDMDGENDAILAIMRPILESIVEQAGNGALASVGSAAQFKVTDPRVQAFLRQKDLILAGINQTTAEKIQSILIDASAEGASVAETGRRIRDQFDEFSKSRADTIARTEAVSANNGAALEGYRQSGVVEKKEWLSSKDDAVRDSHAEVDGEVVALDALFSNGLPTPGVDGPPEEVINCRCTVLPVLED